MLSAFTTSRIGTIDVLHNFLYKGAIPELNWYFENHNFHVQTATLIAPY